jgi:FkbM family methyltransferase
MVPLQPFLPFSGGGSEMSFVSYAQNMEDVMLWRALGDCVESGFYIDLGAWDPHADSVTKAFYERGWRGINVEPNRDFFARLLTHRVRDLNLCVAVTDHLGSTEMNFLSNSGLSTLDGDIATKHGDDGSEIRRKLVSLTTLAKIWSDHVPSGQDVHFLKIDIEGSEAAALRGNNWELARPWIVVVESTLPGSQVDSFEAWEDILLEANYLFAYADGLNRFYLAGERRQLLSRLRHPPNVFDGFVSFLQSHAEVRAELAEVRAELAEVRAELAEAEIISLQRTHSWRMTAPIRWVRRQLFREGMKIFKEKLLSLIKKALNGLPFFVVVALQRSQSSRRKTMQIKVAPGSPASGRGRLLFDVGRVSKLTRVTGITRVIVEIGIALAKLSPAAGFELIFFRLDANGRILEAEKPALNQKADGVEANLGREILLSEGDIILFPDVVGAPSGPRPREISKLQALGAKVFFIGYDMLPMSHPQFFTRLSRAVYRDWTRSVLHSDGLLSISEATQKEFLEILGNRALRRNPKFDTHVISLGSTLQIPLTQASPPPKKAGGAAAFRFLMVGTLEPRKGYSEVLDVFGQLWLEGYSHTLTIIGGAGWKTDGLIERITNHRELGRRLRWLSEASDQDLWESYRTSDALIANSAAEGFGLPLIEASLSGLPLIVNTIPPFQEIAGDNAFYFESGINESLKTAIRSWCELYRSGSHPDSSGIEVRSWDEVAGTLVKSVIPGR